MLLLLNFFLPVADFYMQNGLTALSDEIGVSVTIEETRLMPSLLSDCIGMAPGYAYDVQLSMTEISRIESPYTSKCRDDYPEKCRHYGAYSMSRCTQGCIKYQMSRACNCTDALLIEGDLEENYMAMKMCNNNDDMQCLQNLFTNTLGRQGMEENTVKPCTPECNKVKYSVIIKRQLMFKISTVSKFLVLSVSGAKRCIIV